MKSYKQQENSNKKRRGILEEDVPNETAKAAYYHKPYELPGTTVIEYIREIRRKKHGDI